MDKTLYLLRRHPNEIAPALFHEADSNIEVVLIEQPGSISYDDLVRKIFEADRTIVL